VVGRLSSAIIIVVADIADAIKAILLRMDNKHLGELHLCNSATLAKIGSDVIVVNCVHGCSEVNRSALLRLV